MHVKGGGATLKCFKGSVCAKNIYIPLFTIFCHYALDISVVYRIYHINETWMMTTNRAIYFSFYCFPDYCLHFSSLARSRSCDISINKWELTAHSRFSISFQAWVVRQLLSRSSARPAQRE